MEHSCRRLQRRPTTIPVPARSCRLFTWQRRSSLVLRLAWPACCILLCAYLVLMMWLAMRGRNTRQWHQWFLLSVSLLCTLTGRFLATNPYFPFLASLPVSSPILADCWRTGCWGWNRKETYWRLELAGTPLWAASAIWGTTAVGSA